MNPILISRHQNPDHAADRRSPLLSLPFRNLRCTVPKMRNPEIEILTKSKLETDREKCILLIKKHLQENQTDAQSWYDLACCFDFLGLEKEAEPAYKKVFALGPKNLLLNDQTGFYVGYGSTLRNNSKFAESEKILREGIQNFPDSAALKVFLSFTLYSIGEPAEACRVLLKMSGQLPNEVMDGYARAVKFYAQRLDVPPPTPSLKC